MRKVIRLINRSVAFRRCNRGDSSVSKNSAFEPLAWVASRIVATRESQVETSPKGDATGSTVPCTLTERTGYSCRNCLVILICFLNCRIGTAEDTATFQPFFEKHCTKCHGADKQKGDVRLDNLAALDTDHWLLIYETLSYEEMPPDDEPQPNKIERTRLIKLALSKLVGDSAPVSTGFRRLNKREYGNTVRDLLGLKKGTFNPGAYIYDDEIDHGFDTEAEQLVISNELLIEYMQAARKSLQHALFSASREKPAVQTRSIQLSRAKGGSGRYFNTHKTHVIGRCGGKEKIFDGTLNRVMATPGRYTITVTASAVDRDFYPVRFTPEKGPVIMGFGIMPETAASLAGVGLVKETFELKDDVEQTFQFDSWIDKDHFPYFSFVNGSSKPITQIRSNIRRRKLPAKAAKEPYRGPGIKITKFTIEGPFHDLWPPESFRATYDSAAIPDLSNPEERKALIERFAKRAFRRPVSNEDVAPWMEYYDQQYSAFNNRHSALIETFAAMMTSLDFLYIRDEQPKTLSAYELANRLSYFLWSTMPDAELFALAESGEILKPEVLEQQTRRLLADARSREFGRSFVNQWLTLDTLGSMPPDGKDPRFRAYQRDNLEAAMLEETRRFFHHILQQNRSVRDFIDSDYTFLNRGLADLYGVPFKGSKDEFVRVTLPNDSQRGGLLGQGSVLTLTSNGVETSPVVRGHWVLAEFLGTPPPPAPKEVPALVPDLNGATTVREQLAKHRADAACVECHRQMDPLGMSLEAFDPIGRLRSKYENKRPVTTYGTYKGKDFKGVDDLKQIMLKDLSPFARNLTIRIAEYAKGRRLTAADYLAVEQVIEAVGKNDYQLQDIVKAVAVGELLRNR